jgi:hypothetical protein
MVPGIYKLSSVVLPAATIGQITDSELAPGIEEILEGGSAAVDPSFCAVGEAKPMFSFTTTDIAGALTACGLGALNIAAETDFYFAAIKPGGVIDTGTTHIKLSLTSGMLVPRRLEGTQGRQPARISYDLYATSSDGLVNPITIATGQALPSQGVVANLWTIGPVKINASSIQAVQSVSWDFALTPEVLGGDGEPYPTFAGVSLRRPVCAINGLDVSAFNLSTTAGLALTSFITYFRKIAQGGTRVANATVQHVKLNGTQGMLYPRSARGRHEKPFEGDWNIVPTYDGTNNIVQVSTASAIT